MVRSPYEVTFCHWTYILPFFCPYYKILYFYKPIDICNCSLTYIIPNEKSTSLFPRSLFWPSSFLFSVKFLLLFLASHIVNKYLLNISICWRVQCGTEKRYNYHYVLWKNRECNRANNRFNLIYFGNSIKNFHRNWLLTWELNLKE